MIISNFENYAFKNSDIQGIITSINFSLQNEVELICHEETQDIFGQIKDLSIVKAFPPLVFSFEVDSFSINKPECPLEVQKLYLLDGHHRLEHIVLYNYDYPVPVVLVEAKSVEVQSYNSKINGNENIVTEFLLKNNFKPSTVSDYFIRIQDKEFSSKDICNIYDLYDFKRKLINLDLISPVRNDIVDDNNIIVDFTPIKLSEFNNENYLFPPKSTWISPRI